MFLAYKTFNKATVMVTRNAVVAVGMVALLVGFGAFVDVFVGAVVDFVLGAVLGSLLGGVEDPGVEDGFEVDGGAVVVFCDVEETAVVETLALVVETVAVVFALAVVVWAVAGFPAPVIRRIASAAKIESMFSSIVISAF